MKFSIGYRLFLAVLLSILAVAAAGVELTRWKLFDNFSDRPTGPGFDRIDYLVNTLSARYRQHHDWSFLPGGAEQRKAWVAEEFARSEQGHDARPGEKPRSPSLGYRIGLLDKGRHYLAGAIANPIIVAFASIDQFGLPIVVDGQTVGHLVVARPQNPDDELAVAFLIQQQGNLFVVATIAVLLSGLAATLLAAHFRRPIRQLVDCARRLESARFDTRSSLRRSDELGELAVAFDHLAQRLEDTETARRQWIADTSHELRTPLSVLRGQMEALQDGVRAATPENIALMLRQILSLSKLVDEIYELARADVGQLQYKKEASDLWRLVHDVFGSFSERFRAAGISAALGASPPRSTVYCDIDRMRQVVTNLLENCVRYTAAGGRVEVNGIAVDHELRIVIDDSLPSVPEPMLSRLGERFFRLESSRSRQLGGAGLGLALCKQILHAHEGRLEFGTSPLQGLRVTMVLRLEDSL